MTVRATRVPFATSSEIEAGLPHALAQLRADGLLAYPTETVYGFGGAASSAAAAALRQLKRREPFKPFLLLVENVDQAPGVQWSPTSRQVAELFWPGPLTLVLRAVAGAFPEGIRADDGTVALRASPHPGAQALVRAWGAPLTSSSANTPGRPPARSAAEVDDALQTLGAGDVLVLDGGVLPRSAPSTIVSCRDGVVRVLRQGAISAAALQRRLQGTGIHVE
jgi:L-threonylcarbamoyladenylate synthase